MKTLQREALSSISLSSSICVCLCLDTLQSQLINMGVIPTLVKLLGIHCQNSALTEMCLVAFGNLAELGKSWGAAPPPFFSLFSNDR